MHQDNKLSELVELMITILKPDLAAAEAWKNMQVSTSAWLQDFNTSTSFNENNISAIRQITSNKKTLATRECVFDDTLSGNLLRWTKALARIYFFPISVYFKLAHSQ